MKRTLARFASALLLAAAAHAAPPANDNFANAQVLTGKSGHLVLDISDATVEFDEFSNGDATVWFRVSIPAGKTVVLDTFGSDFDTALEAGPGTSVANFSGYYQSEDAQDTLQSRLLVRSFQDSGSEIHHVRARGNGAATGSLHLNYLIFDGPIFELSGSASFVTREGSVAEVGVFRDGKAKVAASVQVMLADLSATAGADYLGLPVTLNFASGETFKTAHVPIYEDGDNEGPENVRVVLVNTSANAIVGYNDRGEILIDDLADDPANDLFADAEVLNGLDSSTTGDTTGAGTETGEYPANVGLNGYSSYSRTVWYCWTPGASGLASLRITGRAAAGQEFAIGVGTGLALETLTSAITGAQTYDGDADEQQLLLDVTAGETYWIMVTAAESDGGPFTLKYKLLEAGALEVVPNQTFREDSGTVTVTVRRVGGDDGIVTVKYETTAPGGFSPEADPASDYTAVTNTLTFGDGVTEQTFTIALTADSDVEGTENIPIRLSAATGGAVVLFAERNIYIDEEEDGPANDLFANAETITGAEGDVAGDNTGAGAEVDEPAGLKESVWYSWTVPATGFADIFGGAHLSVWRGGTLAALTEVASGDYGTSPFAVTAGETLHVAVSTIVSAEYDYTAAPYSIEWELSTGNLIRFSSDTYTVNETAGFATIRIERDGPTAKAASVFLETSTPYYFFAPGNATAGADFKDTRIKVSIPAGKSFKDVQIPIYRDNETEGTESLRLDLDDASDGSTTDDRGSARLDIIDDADYAPQKAAFFGLLQPITGPDLLQSGYLTATTDAKGNITGKLLLGGKAYSFKGTVSAAGTIHILIPRKGTPPPTPLTLDLQLGDGFTTLAGTLLVDGTTLEVSAHRATFTKKNPAVLAGRFTAVLEGDGTIGAPDAPGYAIIGITPATGAVKIAGALADGTKFTWGTYLAADGTIPVSVLLYKLKGILQGDLTLGDYIPTQDGGGNLHWVHPVQTKGQFLTAFEADLSVHISAYAYTKNVRALPLPDPGDATIDISDTAATVLLSKAIRIDNKSAVAVVAPPTNLEKVTVKIATATGLLSGSFKHTDGKTIPCTGVVFQRTARGTGFFLGATVNGTVEIAE